MAILVALNCHAVARLKQTWQQFGKNRLQSEQFNTLNTLMDPKKSYKNYRMALNTCIENKFTCVPFLGVILSDFTFFDDANADLTEEETVNFQKFRMVTTYSFFIS